MRHKKITERICQPTPDEVKAARLNAGLSQTQAAELVSQASKFPYKTWASYETKEGKNKRVIPLVVWEFFLLLTDQHPVLKIVSRS